MNETYLIAKHLGKKSAYIETYTPALLEPIPRTVAREEIGITAALPFHGTDLWTAFELSWLNSKGKPRVGIAEFRIPAESKNLIESKSFKLYLNSLNQSQFSSSMELQSVLTADLSHAAEGDVSVKLFDDLSAYDHQIDNLVTLGIETIDDLDITINDYSFNPDYLIGATSNSSPMVKEILTSHLLKSNCLVTYQPDWGSVYIKYEGRKINREQLLRYIISFRQHNEFHEQCVERIFTDINRYCAPEKLTVFARYTRRGGLDINPFRSNYEFTLPLGRLIRQ